MGDASGRPSSLCPSQRDRTEHRRADFGPVRRRVPLSYGINDANGVTLGLQPPEPQQLSLGLLRTLGLHPLALHPLSLRDDGRGTHLGGQFWRPRAICSCGINSLGKRVAGRLGRLRGAIGISLAVHQSCPVTEPHSGHDPRSLAESHAVRECLGRRRDLP